MQIGHVNKFEEFQKDMQITFLKKRSLSYMQDRLDSVIGIWYKIKKVQRF